MRKIYSLVFLLSFCLPHNSFSQFNQPDDFINVNSPLIVNNINNVEGEFISEITHYSWDNVQNDWLANLRAVYNYNDAEKISELFYDNWFMESWQNRESRIYTYDTDGNMITELIDYANEYSDDQYLTYMYNDKNLLVEKIQQDKTASGWVNQTRHVYIYNESEKLIEDQWFTWDKANSTWILDLKTVFTYTGNKLIEESDFILDAYNNTWHLALFKTYLYRDDNLIMETYKEFDGTQLIDKFKVNYIYDENNKLILMVYESQTSDWEPYSRMNYVYTDNGTLQEMIYQVNRYSHWRYDRKFTYKYHQITSVDRAAETPGDFVLLSNYPNPFNPQTTIEYYIPELSFVTIKVFDLIGNEIATLVNEEKSAGSYKIEFNAKKLSSGMYLYTLTAGKFSQTRKMILIK